MKAYAQMNDANAFSELYQRFEAKLFGYFARRLSGGQGGKGSDATDLFQRTWLKVHEARKTYDSSRKFSSWFFTIAQNLLRDHLGSAYVRTTFFSEDEKLEPQSKDNVEADFFVKQEWQRVQAALATISPAQKEAFLLFEWEGFSPKEIAEHLSVSESNARQLVSRARAKLKTLLTEEEV